MSDAPLYGLMAEYESADHLLAAARAAHGDGYRRLEAYSPFPVEGIVELLEPGRERLPLIVLLCALAGGAGFYLLEIWSAVFAYPLNVGGRPLFSWPAFVPPAVEITLLSGALGAVIGMLVLNGLPRLRHPVFEVDGFERASTDRFFLCLRADDPSFDEDRARAALQAGGHSLRVVRVQGMP
jgi:hypothetical protein